MKTILLFLLLFVRAGCTDKTKVYVCSSKYARKYHFDPHCHGLSNCSRRIVETTLGNAEKSGKTLCILEK